MKVKNSKYWMLLLALMVSSTLTAQLNTEGFSVVKRDTEVTRITFDNYLKKWNGEVMLNRFRETTADYKSGEGITINVLAENAHIYMSVQGGSFENADGEIMDTFFSDDMIILQKERLQKAVERFVVDFKNYLPKLKDNERITFLFDVKDQKRRKNGKDLPDSELAYKRTYRLEASMAYKDFQAFKNGSLSEAEFIKAITIN
jgi:hypothetical protein